MPRDFVHVCCLAFGVMMIPVAGLAQSPVPSTAASSGLASIVVANDTLQARLEQIAHRSSLWREAIGQLQGTGRYVVVVTPDQVLVKDAPDAATSDEFDPTVVAAVSPVPRSDSQVAVVLVVVNLPLIERVHRQRYSTPAELSWDLDRILVHEIYGHALPYLLAGNLSGRCADPAPGERASDACSIRRENAVRAELRLGRRTSYGLGDLVLARRSVN